jgi:hypothetical protein
MLDATTAPAIPNCLDDHHGVSDIIEGMDPRESRNEGSWRVNELAGYRLRQGQASRNSRATLAWVLSKAFEPTKPAASGAAEAASSASDTVGVAGMKLQG